MFDSTPPFKLSVPSRPSTITPPKGCDIGHRVGGSVTLDVGSPWLVRRLGASSRVRRRRHRLPPPKGRVCGASDMDDISHGSAEHVSAR